MLFLGDKDEFKFVNSINLSVCIFYKEEKKKGCDDDMVEFLFIDI